MRSALAREVVAPLANVAIEPLVDGWPAWLLTLDPVVAGFYRKRHLDILASFLAHPDRHEKAVRDPRLAGGAFCDLAGVPRIAVEEHAAWYAEVSAPHIGFASEVAALRHRLATSDHVPDYDELSTSLRGRVEVRRNDHGRPELRVLRGPTSSCRPIGLAVWRNGERRPMFSSTPRLAADPRVRVSAGELDDIIALTSTYHRGLTADVATRHALALGLDIADLFEPTRVAPDRPATRSVRFLGHASVSVQLRSGVLVSDPVPPASNPLARGLADVRAVLLSHGHPDHFSAEALLPLVSQQPVVIAPRCRAGSLFDASLAGALRRLGFSHVVELGPYEEHEGEDLRVIALPFLGEHGGLPIDAKSAFHVATHHINLVLAADATGVEPAVFADLRDGVRTDMLVIGMEPAGARAGWLYGAMLGPSASDRQLADQPLTGASADEVVALAQALGTRCVRIYGTSSPGMSHIFGRSSGNPSKLRAEVDKLRTAAARAGADVLVLDTPGQAVTVEGAS